jgi:hypothetical protein
MLLKLQLSIYSQFSQLYLEGRREFIVLHELQLISSQPHDSALQLVVVGNASPIPKRFLAIHLSMKGDSSSTMSKEGAKERMSCTRKMIMAIPQPKQQNRVYEIFPDRTQCFYF